MTPLPATIDAYREMARKHGSGAVGRCIIALCDALQDCEAAIKAAENAQAVDRDFKAVCDEQRQRIAALELELRAAYSEIDRLREDVDFDAIHDHSDTEHRLAGKVQQARTWARLWKRAAIDNRHAALALRIKNGTEKKKDKRNEL